MFASQRADAQVTVSFGNVIEIGYAIDRTATVRAQNNSSRQSQKGLAYFLEHLKNKTYQRALDRLATNIRGWSGGTRIGASLAMFNDQWLRRIDKRTIVIILSDGWDTGEPEKLATALAQLRQRAGRLIWLNPLLGSADYVPATRGMQAALPFIKYSPPRTILRACAHSNRSWFYNEPQKGTKAQMIFLNF